MHIRVRFKKRECTFCLSARGIDESSEWLADGLSEGGADKTDCLRMRLLFEEALLNMRERFGEEAQASANLERWQGSYRLRLSVKGDRFNPLKSEIDEQADLVESLFSVIDLHVQYSYSKGSNVLRFSLARKSMNPVLKIVIAIVIGSVIGIVGNYTIPDALQEAFTGTVLDPIAAMWVRLLQAISGPVIFLTALTASFGTKRITEYGGSRVSALARYFAISALVVLFTMVVSRAFFPLDVVGVDSSRNLLAGTLDGVLQLIPSNLIEPFREANTPQLLLIAIVTGYVLAAMEQEFKELNVIIRQLTNLGYVIARLTCSLVPFFVGFLLFLKIWTHDTALLGGIWLPLVLSTAVSIAVLFVSILTTSVRFRANPLTLALKLKDPFIEALKRGTLDFSTVEDLADSCDRQLGVDNGFARAVLPQGLFLYMPTSAVGICIFVLYAAQVQGLHIDQMWIISAATLSVVLAVATPPVTGSNLLSFVVAFSYLGISSDAFLDVMVFDLVFGVLCIALDQAMLQIETVHQANGLGFLNEKVLRAPVAKG